MQVQYERDMYLEQLVTDADNCIKIVMFDYLNRCLPNYLRSVAHNYAIYILI